MPFCPVGYALNVLAGKWKLQTVYAISQAGTVRFNELQRSLPGISNLMLSKTLKELEENGIVTRVQYNEVPPHVEYSLSEIGKGIIPAFDKLGEWGNALHEQLSK